MRARGTLFEIEQKPNAGNVLDQVIGTATFPVENGQRIAVLKAQRVVKCAP